MGFFKEPKIPLLTKEEIIALKNLQEIDYESLSGRELWILQNFSERGDEE
ncbi:MAG: hypothetical protein Q7K34_02120 [archaeon]|nr:hypothetical protein [archaeon]